MNDLDQTRRAQRDAKPSSRPPKPDILMPAMPPLGLIHAVENWLRARMREVRRRRRFRRRFLPLLGYDDHILRDMGHCREEIEWALHLPLREDAHRALQRRRARRAPNERRASTG